MRRLVLAVGCTFCFTPFLSAEGAAATAAAAGAEVSTASLMGHIARLASDEFEGRAPGTAGEEKTVAYLREQLEALGLEPAGDQGSFVQRVPLVGLTARARAGFRAFGGAFDPALGTEMTVGTRRFEPLVAVSSSELVFVGYGARAPEYGWDDYKGADLKGKTLLMLVNDPPIPDPKDPAALDESMFKGKAMTYYGRWTYKYEIASELGAAAAIIVHETGPAGYPWEVVSASFGRENFDIDSADGNAWRVPVEAWISSAAAARLVAMSGRELEELKLAALKKDFRPIPLGVSFDASLDVELRRVGSANVAARLPGSDPGLKDEHLIYTAHWDHLGRSESIPGADKIYNGALDNASGVAALLELAKVFAKMPQRPKRSVLFLAVTAEEKGLLGSKYYAAHPAVPLEKTLAALNMDVLNPWGPAKDAVVIGLGLSTLDETLETVARRRGRLIVGDPEPEKGRFYRSDHFEFAKKGVPALDWGPGTQFLGRDPEFGLAKRAQYTSQDYHKVSDEIKPDWDLSGMAEDVRLLLDLGWELAEGPLFPRWKPGAEFKAVREAALKKP